MSFYQAHNHGLLLGRKVGARRVALNTDPPSGDLSIALTLEYVDQAGVRQLVNPMDPEAPAIVGVAPFLLTLDATASRAPTAFAVYAGDEPLYQPASYPNNLSEETRNALALEAFSLVACGFLTDFGGAMGAGNYAYPEGQGRSRNEARGLPVYPVVVTTPGTYTVRQKMRDPLGNETTVSFTITAIAPEATVHIPVSAGAWPTLVDNRRYTLDAGGDYRSFGALETGDCANVSVEKVGVGADPRVATWRIDPRSKFSATTMYPTRARAVRFVGIDVDHVQEDQRGFDYCGLVGGRCGRFTGGSQSFLFHEGDDFAQSACRYGRGLFFVDCVLNNVGDEGGFTLFGTWKHLHLLNCVPDAIDTGPTTWLVLRTYGTKHSYRHCKIRISHPETPSCGTPLSILAENGIVETTWPETDRPAPIGSSEKYGLRQEHSVEYNCQFYDATSSRANAVFSTGGNPSGSAIVRPWLVGSEDCVFYQSGAVAISNENFQLMGRGIFLRNARRDMGAGSSLGASTNTNPNPAPNVDWHGPYLVEEANTRPVPTAFD